MDHDQVAGSKISSVVADDRAGRRAEGDLPCARRDCCPGLGVAIHNLFSGKGSRRYFSRDGADEVGAELENFQSRLLQFNTLI